MKNVEQVFLNGIIHRLNELADNFYSYAHPVKKIIVDYENSSAPPELLTTPWVTKNGNKTKQKRIIVGESYLKNMIINDAEYIKVHTLNHFFGE